MEVNQLDLYRFPTLEEDEGVAQMPNKTIRHSFIRGEEEDALESEEICNPVISEHFSKINSSITFRKPTNISKVAERSSSYDADTQCDSAVDEDEDEVPLFTEEQALQSQRDYERLMMRTTFLVQETKGSKFKGLVSPIVLRNKLYDLLASKTGPVDPEFMFQEWDFSRSHRVKRTSTLIKDEKNNIFPQTFTKKSRSKSLCQVNDGGIFDSFLKYLTQVN